MTSTAGGSGGFSDPVPARSASRLYSRAWRWHFFSALIVVPFVLWQSVTGTIYLWHREIAALAYPQLLHVATADARVSYQQQLETVLQRWPPGRLQGIEIESDLARSTAFFFRDDNGLAFPAFVDPYSGRYLGAVESTHWIAGLSRGLHGGWPINPFGSYLLELGASWAIVMILTGLYLWWPRNSQGPAGVLYPRLRNGSRTFWRDLHATVGVYFSLIVLAFLFSALPWTTAWGDLILKPIQRATDQLPPTAKFAKGGGDHHHAQAPGATANGGHAHHGHEAAAATTLSLDELIASARAAGAGGAIEVKPVADFTLMNVRSQRARASDEVLVQLDARSGAVLAKATWQDYAPIPKMVSTGIDLHEGRFFGRANQVFNTLVALSLIWLSVTGFIGWYKRRPAGSLSAPPRREGVLPKTVLGTGAALCVALPLFGISVLGIWLLDVIMGNRLFPARRRGIST